jgi:putative salt-induced outer membrane protein YdiY
VALADVKQIRSQAGETAYEKSLHPPLYDAWKLGVNFGFALARGNSNTTTLNTGFNADRKTMDDEITLYESSVYTTSNVPGVSSGVTANEVLGGAKYDRNITKDMFAFVSGDFTHDALQDLILQQIYTAGLGWHAIDTPGTTLDVLAGLNYTRASYSAGLTSTGATTGVDQNLAGVTMGEDFMHKFNKVATATEQFYFYPDLSNTGQYRFSLDSALNTKINTWLAWQVAFSDRYITNPPILGTKSNDAIFTTGLNITFNH